MSIDKDPQYSWADEQPVVPDKLGEGTFGSVMDLKNGLVEKSTDSITFETTVGNDIIHPNILNFMMVSYFKETNKLVYTYKKKDVTLLDVVATPLMAKQLVCAVQALNIMGFYHFDIKPENIFVNIKDSCLVLGDLGGCIPIINDIKTTIGTIATAAPEHTTLDKFYETSQTWAIGVTLLISTLAYRKDTKYLFKNINRGNVVESILPHLDSLVFDKKVENVSELRSFIKYCLIPNPATRPDIARLLMHKYLRNVAYESPMPILRKTPSINFIPTSNVLHKLMMIPNYENGINFTALCMILNLAHYTEADLFYIVDYVDHMISHPGIDISSKNIGIAFHSLLPSNSLYYSMNGIEQFNNFIIEYIYDPRVYASLKPVPSPFRVKTVYLNAYVK